MKPLEQLRDELNEVHRKVGEQFIITKWERTPEMLALIDEANRIEEEMMNYPEYALMKHKILIALLEEEIARNGPNAKYFQYQLNQLTQQPPL